jgi:hypothetical protein
MCYFLSHPRAACNSPAISKTALQSRQLLPKVRPSPLPHLVPPTQSPASLSPHAINPPRAMSETKPSKLQWPLLPRSPVPIVVASTPNAAALNPSPRRHLELVLAVGWSADPVI